MAISAKLERLFPFLTWLPELNRSTLRADFGAGLTGAVIVLPQGVAFATIAGMPPHYGLYAAMVPAIVAALFGSSRHLVSGPTTAASIVLFSALAKLAPPGTPEYISLALTLTFMVGITELVMGLARLGTLVNFISHSVVLGFTAGAALLIATSQLRHLFDVAIPGGGHVTDRLIAFSGQVDVVNWYAAAVGLVTLATGIIVRRIDRRLPYLIIAMVIGSLAGVGLNHLPSLPPGLIETVGALPGTLPPLSAPDLSLTTLKELAPAVLAVTLFALTEAVSIARSLATRSGHGIDGNQEFIGQGLSNIVGSFFSAYVATGSFNRSAINYEAGARTPLAAVFAGALLVGVALVVAPLTAYLPKAAMAGILLLVAWGLIDWRHIRQVIRASRAEAAILGITFAATLFLDLEFAILLGVLASLAVYLNKTSRPRMLIRVPDPAHPQRKFTTDPALSECPQLRIVRIDGSIWFGAVSWIGDRLRRWLKQHPGQTHLLVVAPGVNFVDVAGAEFLASEARKRRAMGGGLYLYRLKPGVCGPLTAGGYFEHIGAENTFESKTEAIATIVDRLDPAVCARCRERIFRECAGRPGAAPAEPAT